MTIIDALADAINETLKVPAVVIPQASKNISTEHIELAFIDCVPNGTNDTITFSATFKTGGTHKKWLENTMNAKRELHRIVDDYMPVTFNNAPLRAYWESIGNPQWVYNDESEGGMPEYYQASWTVTIDCPTRLLTGE